MPFARRFIPFVAAALSFAAAQPGGAQQDSFRNVVTGEVLNLEDGKQEGHDTPGVKKFLETRRNPYQENAACLVKGKDLFLTACSGCHGHLGEGKIGPGLNDNYWTYPQAKNDQGLFEVIFGGARAQMGPQALSLSLDEILVVMAWVRHLYTGPVADADWLDEQQKKFYTPYKEEQSVAAKPGQTCAP